MFNEKETLDLYLLKCPVRPWQNILLVVENALHNCCSSLEICKHKCHYSKQMKQNTSDTIWQSTI